MSPRPNIQTGPLKWGRSGDYAKVSAFDVTTNVEASIVDSPRTTQQQLMRVAVRKLEYAPEKQRHDGETKPGRGIKV